MSEAVKILRVNACAQIAASSLLGTIMLLPMQPWFPWRASGKTMKEMLAVHLDWLMLGFMQCAAASLIQHHMDVRTAPRSEQVLLYSKLLCFGGWVNPFAYLFRGFGIDAFVLGGSLTQKLAATIGAISAGSILIAWVGLFKVLADDS